MINHGEVEIIIDNVLQSTQGEGGSFGELALIHGCPRAATVRVSTKTIFCLSFLVGHLYRDLQDLQVLHEDKHFGVWCSVF